MESSKVGQFSTNYQVQDLLFTPLSAKEVRCMSVKEITETSSFGVLSGGTNPLPGGLYDPHLGPPSFGEICATCGKSDDCPGHTGHIELVQPVYHPFFIKQLGALLKHMCFSCKKFRHSGRTVQEFTAKFRLLRAGLETESSDFTLDLLGKLAIEKEIDGDEGKDGQKVCVTDVSKDQMEEAHECETVPQKSAAQHRETVGKILTSIRPGREQHKDLLESRWKEALKNGGYMTGSSSEKEAWETLVKAFFAATPQMTCSSCGCKSGIVRVDGYTKIFRNPHISFVCPLEEQESWYHITKDYIDECILPNRVRVGFVHQSGIIFIECKQRGRGLSQEHQEYLLPLTVRKLLADIAVNEGPILQFLFPGGGFTSERIRRWICTKQQSGSALSDCAWNVFFVDTVVVPPNQFRPLNPSSTGGDPLLPAASIVLRQILEANARVRQCMVAETEALARRLQAKELRSQSQGNGLTPTPTPTASLLGGPGAGTMTDEDDLEREATTSQEQEEDDPTVENDGGMGGLKSKAEDDLKAAAAVGPAVGVKVQVGTLGEARKPPEQYVMPLGSAMVQLQDRVNCMMDASKQMKANMQDAIHTGVRQVLEKKQGLFRMKMMGKRVNFAARSVISPDAMLETNQIGIPQYIAMKLSVPESVNRHNLDKLTALVTAGAHAYPGALAVIDRKGQEISLIRSGVAAKNLWNTAYYIRTAVQRETLALQIRQETQAITDATSLGHVSAVGQRSWQVLRHVSNGDPLLVNRQPTLHKPGIMAHFIKVLRKENTIRMHYANCNTYNADFDGDEINLHCPQDLLSRAEAKNIVNADLQYLGPTAGKPLRGLIQDHVIAGVYLTQRDRFLSRSEVWQLVYTALRAATEFDLPVESLDPYEMAKQEKNRFTLKAEERYHLSEMLKKSDLVEGGSSLFVLDPPAIRMGGGLRLWTGKQVISMVLKALCRLKQMLEETQDKVEDPPLRHLTVSRGMSTTSGKLWRASNVVTESGFSAPDDRDVDGDEVIEIQKSEMLTGVLDKKSFGASEGGIVHVCFENLGGAMTGLLLTGLSRMFTMFLQMHGFSCNYRDLVITQDADRTRDAKIAEAHRTGWNEIKDWVKTDTLHEEIPDARIGPSVQKVFGRDTPVADLAVAFGHLERRMQGIAGQMTSELVKQVLPAGQLRPFPENCFASMVNTGAKGSKVNHSMITCWLGQQVLEGKRVPQMPDTMRTLPCFAPFDLGARAGGYVLDRFLSGYRPQEFFFHCMSGREGLVDTAVKTATSGYLQRCLIKHLEGLSVAYDLSVRDAADKSIVQFMYGEDGLDVCKAVSIDSAAKLKRLDVNLSELTRAQRKKMRSEDQSDEKELEALIADAKYNYNRFHAAALKSKEADFSVDSIEVAREAGRDLQMTFRQFVEKDKVAHSVEKAMEKDVDRVLSCLERRVSDEYKLLPEPLECFLRPDVFKGILSVKADQLVDSFLQDRARELRRATEGDAEVKKKRVERDNQALRKEIEKRYLRALAQPGEAVGTLAAQGMGEPSTQMTLNTFHLAGSGAANVTLGIPRLREIIQTASRTLKTPTMSIPVKTKQVGERIKGSLEKVSLKQLVKDVLVTERVVCLGGEVPRREYALIISLVDLASIQEQFPQLSRDVISQFMDGVFTPRLDQAVRRFIKRASHKTQVNKAPPRGVGQVGQSGRAAAAEAEADDGGAEEAAGAEEQRAELNTAGRGQRKRRTDAEEDPEDEQAEGANGDGAESDNASEGQYEEEDREGNLMDDDGVDPVSRAFLEALQLQQERDEADRAAGWDDEGLRRDPSDIDHMFGTPGKLCGNDYVLRSSALPIGGHKLSRKVLILEVVEELCKSMAVQSTDGINGVFVNACEGKEGKNGYEYKLTTEGTNLDVFWAQLPELVDHSSFDTNDIGLMLDRYGVEACRALIVKQVQGVFAAYGISVDPRHLFLIADYMTHLGGYRPFNRIAMSQSASPLLQMTFETSMNFLMDAVKNRTRDNLQGAAGAIVVGKPAPVGTSGPFEVRHCMLTQQKILKDTAQRRKRAGRSPDEASQEAAPRKKRQRFDKMRSK